MKPAVVQNIILALLAGLFIYTGTSKLLDPGNFRAGIENQPFPYLLKKTLVALLPTTELIIAAGLVFNRTRKTALFGYVFFMFCFCIYTGLVVFGFFAHRPCGCGGIFNGLSWEGHFIINLIFLLLSCSACWLNRCTMIFMHKQGVSRKPGRE